MPVRRWTVLAIALVSTVSLVASAAADRGRRGVAPGRVSVSAAGDRVRAQVGTYCTVTERGRAGPGPGVCVDAVPPRRPPRPRLEVAPGQTLRIRFRDSPAVHDRVGRVTATLIHIENGRPHEVGPRLDPKRVRGRRGRFELRLPGDLERPETLSLLGANALLLSVGFRPGGDASYFVGLRGPPRGVPNRLLCPRIGSPGFDTRGLLGKSLGRAAAIAAKHGCSLRVGRLNGVPQIVTMDFVWRRINVALVDGRVDEVLAVG